MRKFLRQFIITVALFLVPSIAVVVQSCTAVAAQNNNQWASNCGNVELGFACYGSGNVRASYINNGIFGNTTDSLFTRPGDQVPIVGFARTYLVSALETTSNSSTTVIEVQANIPVQNPINRTTFVLMGNARIENGASVEEAVVLLDSPILSPYSGGISVFSAPEGTTYDVVSQSLGTLNGSGNVEADGISADRQWVRVFYPWETKFGTQRTTGWVRVGDLDSPRGVRDLPFMSENSYSGMQKVYLTTGSASCNAASGVLVKSPPNIETTILVNEMPIRLQGTLFIENTADDQLAMTVLEGTAMLWATRPNNFVLTQNQVANICLSQPTSLGVDGAANDRRALQECVNIGTS